MLDDPVTSHRIDSHSLLREAREELAAKLHIFLQFQRRRYKIRLSCMDADLKKYADEL